MFEKFTFQTFLGGLLFDLSVIAYLNSFFLVAHLIPGNFKYKTSYQTILKISFYLINLVFIATNFVDIIYYRFTGRRSTFGLITATGMENDVIRLIPSFLKEFWYIHILFLITSILFWKLIPNLEKPLAFKELKLNDYLKKYCSLVVVLLLILIIGRGGLQKKPIRIVDAIKFGAMSNTGLVLNTPFSIVNTVFEKDGISKNNYFKNNE